MKSLLAFGLSIFILGNVHIQAQNLASTEPKDKPVLDKKKETCLILGKVVDAKSGDNLNGIAVLVEGTAIRATSDPEGRFVLNLPPGTYDVTFSNVSYEARVEKQISVKAGDELPLEVSLEPKINELSTTRVKGKAKKETQQSLLIQMKNAPSVSNAISLEMIRKTPDRSTADIMKRVSGASIQDNKFAIIRGLSDRYNSAFINGGTLPSSETDRKAFSFDIFPSQLIDNLTIFKTATPDKTGEFAGGIIEINTRDIPEKNFVHLNVGANYHTISTGKTYVTYQGGKLDWLGIDNGSRNIPDGVPTADEVKKMNINQQIELSKKFENNWALQNSRGALPGGSFLASAGWRFKIGKKDAGSILSVNYSGQERFQYAQRNDYDQTGNLFTFNDSIFKFNVLAGAIWNSAIMINSKNRISFKNTFNINSEDQTILRSGLDRVGENNIRSYAYMFQQNIFSSHQLIGDHFLSEPKIKIKWNLSYSRVKRDIPDFRRLRCNQPIDNPDNLPWAAFINFSASPNDGGRFYSNLKENVSSGSLDFTKTINRGKWKTDVKVGGFVQMRDRTFAARVLGYIQNPGMIGGLITLPVDKIFDPANMNPQGFRISENTNPNDKYDAASFLAAGYLMADQKFGERWRFIYGARYEYFNQTLESRGYTNNIISINTKKPDILPSINITYAVNSKTNLRVAASQTVSRPEFRELAPFAFFDFNQFLTLAGNEKLVRTSIINYDFRYEVYPRAGEVFSISLFHKDFTNPIELVLDPAIGGGTRNMSYRNVDKATATGFELEFRKKLPKLKSAKWLEYFTLMGNIALIDSRVDMTQVAGSGREYRPLQGQSPYIINGGILYTDKNNLNLTLMVNRIGRRISTVGTANYLEYIENPRTVVDFQISKSFKKDKMEVKMNIQDILAQDLVFFQPVSSKNAEDFTLAKGRPINTLNFGRTFSISFNYKFK